MAELELADDVREALDGVLDPCLLAAGHKMSVLGLGLISRVEERGCGIEIGITFTEVGCQFTHRVIAAIEDRVIALGRFDDVRVLPDWSLPWTPERMEPGARAALDDGRVLLARRLGFQFSPGQ
jgi:metal-sulfur cluster biosynthetic enzyme